MEKKPTYEELAQRVKVLEQKNGQRVQTEEALTESKVRYRAIVDAFDGLIYICSQDYRVEYMNDRFIERTGHDATGDFCYKALHALDSVCPWCVNDRVFKGETVRWDVQSPKDNRWYYIVNTPIFHIDGSVSKQAMIVDITDRKDIEAAIEISKREWVSTFDAISDWVSLVDSEYKILRSNRAVEKFLKLPPKEVIGRSCCELVHGTKEPIPDCPTKKMFETGRRESLDFYAEETRGWLRVLVDPLRDEQGNIIRAVHIVRDVTEIKQNERALQQSEERLALATANADLAVWEWHYDTGKVDFSSEKFLGITGLTNEETENFSLELWLSKVHPEDLKRSKEKIQAHFKGETDRVENELRVRHPKKGWVWLYGISQIIERDGLGGPIRMIGVHRDITDQKHAEEQRERLIEELRVALKEIKTLRGILPLCSFCKKIRNDEGYWEKVDVYIRNYSEANISHSICPDCMKENYPEEYQQLHGDDQ